MCPTNRQIAVIHRAVCLTLAQLRQNPVDNFAYVPAGAYSPPANFSGGGGVGPAGKGAGTGALAHNFLFF
jgi:hypothetical protein